MRILFCLLFALSCPAAELSKETAPARQQFIIGVSPFLENSAKDEVYRSVVRLLVQELPLESTVSIYDAFGLKTIASVAIPANHAFESAKTRANQFAPAIRDLKAFLAETHAQPVAKDLNFKNALRLPQFWDFISENFSEQTPVTLLLFGSALYQDAQEPAFSMVGGFFPSDAHLRASREDSLYGKPARPATGAPVLVNWVYFGEPWLNELHREKITRFWSLYLEQRGARLASFTADSATALDAFRQGSAFKVASASAWTLEPGQKKLEMLRVTRDMPNTEWLLGESAGPDRQGPPAALVGPMKIGIRWKSDIDLDLYATPRRGAETLFFQHPHSPEGYYYKDHRSSPGREYEFIEFESPVDARQVEAFVNFYQGNCPGGPRAEVRIEFGGRIFAGHVSLSATEGNRGRTGAGQETCWGRIPVQELLKLASTVSQSSASTR